MQAKVEGFLRANGMHFERIDLEQEQEKFIAEMKRGLAGEESSLYMLPTYLPMGDPPPVGEEVIVMDAGGTNFRVGTVRFAEDGAPVIDRFQKTFMPGTKGRLNREEFFDAIADRLLPVAEVSKRVGFCFSFPTEILPNHDGRAVYFTKEVRVDGVEGLALGEGINEALGRRGVAPKEFVLLNDTVATLLGGLAITRKCAFDSYIGYILGTGTNTCYVEDCKNITKAPEACALPGGMIVNMESGGYGLVPQGEPDKALDQQSKDPGRYKMEKMISGAYQGNVVYRTVKQAMEQGLFSDGFCQRARNLTDITLYAVDQFCFYPYGDNELALLTAGDVEDTLTLYEIIDASFERAARLTAVNFGAILTHTGKGKNPTRPVCVTAEGTTFYKSKLFRPKLDYYVRSFLNDRLGVYCEFIQADNATLIGTATAALMA